MCIAAAEHGQSLRDEGKLLEARTEFATCAQRGCPAIVAADCTKWMEKTAEDIPTLTPRARDANGADLIDVKFHVDGKFVAAALDGRKISVNPGTHTVRFEADGFVANEQRIVVIERERRDLLVYLQRPAVTAEPTPVTPPPSPHATSRTPVAAWILTGVAVAGLATFGAFAAIGTSDANELRAGCSGTSSCRQSDVDDVKTKYLIADIGLGVGVAALVGAAVIFLTRPTKTSTAYLLGSGQF